MKITLEEATLNQAVVAHLRAIGVQSDILKVEFRYTRVPYTVFAEVELAEVTPGKSAKVRVPIELQVPAEAPDAPPAPESIVDPDHLPPLEETAPDEPAPELPAAPLFGSN